MAPQRDRGGSLTTWLVLLPHNAHMVIRRFKITFFWNAVLLMCITYLSRDSCRNLICKNLGRDRVSGDANLVTHKVVQPRAFNLRISTGWSRMNDTKTNLFREHGIVYLEKSHMVWIKMFGHFVFGTLTSLSLPCTYITVGAQRFRPSETRTAPRDDAYDAQFY